MPFGDAQLRGFFRTGPVVAFNGVSTYPDGQPVQGLFDRTVSLGLADAGFGGVDMGLPVLRLPYTAFTPMPAPTDLLLVGSTPYTVADAAAEDEGSVICFALKLASDD